MMWQLIETAPKDHSWVLCHGNGPGTVSCPFIAVWEGDGWYEIYSDDKYAPTHWMPLPPPPVSP